MSFDPSMWLDAVRSVPVIGISTKPTFETSSALLDRLRPQLVRWQKAEKLKSLKNNESKGLLSIELHDGLSISLRMTHVTCQFHYLNNIEEQAGVGAPVVKEQRAMTPYRELLDEVKELLRSVMADLSAGNISREVTRIGVVADGLLQADHLPPGFDRFMQHLGEPWGNEQAQVNGDVIAILKKADGYKDNCHHFLNGGGEGSEVMSFKLDWQRRFEKPTVMTPKVLHANIDECVDEAYRYFGRFGMGDLKYAR